MFVLLIAVVCVLAYPIIKHILKFIRINRHLKGIPSVKCIPIVGVLLEIKNTTDVIPVFMKYQNEYGSLVRVNQGIEPNFLLVSDVKMLEFIMSSPKIIDKGFEYVFLENWLGLGLLTSSGEKWRSRRKLITPTYHFQILRQFLDVFNKAGDVLVAKLKNEVGKESIDIYELISLCTLDIICESAMGINVDAQKKQSSDYIQAVKLIGNILIERNFSLLNIYKPLYYFSSLYRKEKEVLKILHGTTNDVIKRRKEALLSKSNENVTENKRLAFLDMLIKASSDNAVLSTDGIREEVDTFMFEGHDTTSSGISFTLYLLSKHSEIQNNVFEEIVSVLNDKKQISHDDLNDMKYLDMVIRESLRLYPPVPFYSRILKEDVEYYGRILPKDLLIQLFAYGLHRNPEIYPDPEKFDPERFLPENRRGRDPFAYIPFSAGPRNCIGQKFAMLEMKSTICTILKSYELLPVVDFEPIIAVELILKSANGIHVKLKERTW